MSQIKLPGFSRRIEERLIESENQNLQNLEAEDLVELISLIWNEVTVCLSEGHRVIFDGWISFFTNPVKRKCYDVQTTDSIKAGNGRESKMTIKRRVRFRPQKKFRQQAETNLSEAQYLALIKEKKTIKK